MEYIFEDTGTWGSMPPGTYFSIIQEYGLGIKRFRLNSRTPGDFSPKMSEVDRLGFIERLPVDTPEWAMKYLEFQGE